MGGEFVETARPILFPQEKLIGTCEAGEIYNVALDLEMDPLVNWQYPQAIVQYIGSNVPNAEKYRRGLASKLIGNEPNPYPMIGKPCSAFLYIPSPPFHGAPTQLMLKYLKEYPSFKREGTPVLHQFIREFDESHQRDLHIANLLLPRFPFSLWSGHFANLTPEYSSPQFTHLMLLDKFADSKISEDIDRQMLNQLRRSKIIPLAAGGLLI